MSQVFISYSHKDKDFVQYLAYRLSELKISLWVDEERIFAGEVWRQAIFDGLNTSDVMILVVSQASIESEEVSNEWQNFLDEKKPIMPVFVEHIDGNKLYPSIRKLQYIGEFAEQSGFDRGFIKLIYSLQKHGVDFDSRLGSFVYKVDHKQEDKTPFFASFVPSLVQHVRALNHAFRLAVNYKYSNLPGHVDTHTKTMQSLINNQVLHDGFLREAQGNLTGIDSILSNTRLPSYIKKFFDNYQELLYADWIRCIELVSENGQRISYAVSIIQPDETLLNDLFNSVREFSDDFYHRITKLRSPPPIAEQLHNTLKANSIQLHGVALEAVRNTEFREQSFSYYAAHCGYVRIDWIDAPSLEQQQLAQMVINDFFEKRYWFLSSFRMHVL